jgi:hypothetical protein
VITFAAKKPNGAPSENWLPIPEGPFELTLRMYAPRPAILDESWKAPPIVRAQ